MYIELSLAIIVKCREAKVKIFQECPGLFFFSLRKFKSKLTASDVIVTVKTILTEMKMSLAPRMATVRLSDGRWLRL